MHPDVRPLEAILPRKAAQFGGKAVGLASLIRAGFPVPAGFAIASTVAAEAMRMGLAPRDRLEALLTAPARDITAERLAEIATQVRSVKIPQPAEDAVRHAVATLEQRGATMLAVRSSGRDEDSSQRSAAGLYSTRLGVVGADAVLEAVRDVWASSYHPRVVLYLRSLGVRGDDRLGIGVVVQSLVPAETAGVMFTVNPLSGDAGELVINAAPGLGSTVVDGRVSPDTFRVDKASYWVRDQVVGEKQVALRILDGALCEEATPATEGACLTTDQVRQLAELGVRIEHAFGDPRDVEWAFVGGRPFVLQARPVTALPTAVRKPRKSKDRSRIVWSNVNVGEALPGVATPLTWSILSDFSDAGFRRAFGSLGCSVPPDAELVGNFRGRIYLNLSEFFAIASQVPGLSPKNILELGGGSELSAVELGESHASSKAFLARLPLTATRFARENFRISERVAVFEAAFEADHARVQSLDLRLLSSVAVHRVLGEVERMLDHSGQVMLNVYGNLLACVILLRTLLSIVGRDDHDRLFRELLSGLLDVESAGPGLELMRIAETARRDPAARALLVETDPRALSVALIPEGPTRTMLERFFAAYGDRGNREAEIAEPRWREDPSFPLATLRLHLLRESSEASVLAVEARQRRVREEAQATLEARLPRFLRSAVRSLFELVQRFLRMRERLRSHVVTVLGLFRRVAVDASRRIESMEPDAGPDAAFYLSIRELHGFLRGDVSSVGDWVKQRRLQLQRDASLPAPPDTFVGFPPPIAPPDPSTSRLSGLGACAGVVEGVVRVMANPSEIADFRPGEILVAQQTDVGWSPLFLVAGGVITDLGGPLSHASIVAREFGIPAVVNVKGATVTLRTGDRVAIDGALGSVRILERA